MQLARRVSALLLPLTMVAAPVHAIDEIAAEEAIAELLATPPRTESEELIPGRRWAVLPEVGYAPDTGPQGGLRVTDRDLAGTGITLDADAVYALNGQESVTLSLGTPHLRGDRLLTLLRARFENNPQRDFFGLGNNDVGPDELSTQLEQRADVELAAGWRPLPRLAVDIGIIIRHLHIGRGDRSGTTPFTVDAFPDLPGVEGGFVSPIALSVVWDTRDGVVRPTRGWRAILKVSHTDRAMLSDFEYTRGVADVGYLFPFHGGAQVLGVRADAAYVAGARGDVPFWEMESLGGDDTLRGFLPRRFLGSGRVLLDLEYRAKLTEFDFLRLWRVQVDGALFGESGRVFLDRDDFGPRVAPEDAHHLRYSGGTGLRFALSQAQVARIDVGFSEEEAGLVYLSFGQTF